jgi:hypothetical protein
VPRLPGSVTVQAGTPVSGINFIMNRTAPTFDIFESSQAPPNSSSMTSAFRSLDTTPTSAGDR